MSAPLSGWRLPLRLALRDLKRYKGRSALAALLIFLPVVVMAAGLTAIATVDISPDEDAAMRSRGVSAVVTVNDEQASGARAITAFPASGRKVTQAEPPTATEISRQADAPAIGLSEEYGVFSPVPNGSGFTATRGSVVLTDLTSPILRQQFRIKEGRAPQRPGEVVITDYGRIIGLPTSGPLGMRVHDGSASPVTVVGVTSAGVPGVAVVGPAPEGVRPTNVSFLVSDSRAWSSSEARSWQKYGLTVSAPGTAIEEEVAPTATDPGMALGIAVGTMAFVAVTALLAAPAFAASATRQRRTLGLVAANGGTRGMLRRMVMAEAMLLGALTAVVATLLGTALGAAAGHFIRVRFYGITPPIDIRVSWMLAIVAVATFASLVAAFAPAMAAGRTNLLAALRGQVSSRTVKRRLPVVGVIGVVIGTLCLYRAVTLDNDDTSQQTLLAYVGVPLFFGGAVLAVPYVLMAAGKLAGHLPLTARIAVRDVSRQRTRATASVGAVLATVAVCTGVTVLASSVDAHERATYTPSVPMGTGQFTNYSGIGTQPRTQAEVDAGLAAARRIASPIVPLWVNRDNGEKFIGFAESCPTAGDYLDSASLETTYIDASGMDRLGLSETQRSVLESGGVLLSTGAKSSVSAKILTPARQGPHTITLKRFVAEWSDTGRTKTSSCTPVSLEAAPIPEKRINDTMKTDRGTTAIMLRSTAEKHEVPTEIYALNVAPAGGIDTRMEAQLKAAAPFGLDLYVERGYSSPMSQILLALTALAALLVVITTVISTLLNDAESRADAATLATVGAPLGMRRRIVGAHAAAIGFIGSVVGIAIGLVPGLILARDATGTAYTESGATSVPGTYVVPWWLLLILLVGVPLLAAAISMTFARRTPPLTRREA